MAEPIRAELCIIGAGALGIALAKHAHSHGAKVVLVSREAPESGDNPHLSLHLAALSASAGLISSLRNGQSMGLSSLDGKISVRAVQERAARIVEEAKGENAPAHLAAQGIEFVAGPTRFSDKRVLLVGEKEIRANSYILAVGADWVAPPIPGLDEINVLTPETLLANTRKLTHLLMIGGDAEGFVMAQIYARLGSSVTLVPQGDILPGYDRESVALLLAELRRDGVRILDGAFVQSIHPRAQGTGATVAHPNGDVEALDLSHVAIAGTRRANTATLELDKMRVRALPSGTGVIAAGSAGGTTNPRVRAVGHCAGMTQWQQALEHGRGVIDAVVLGQTRTRLLGTARMVATEPALIEVGKVPDPAGVAKAGYKILRSTLADNELAMAAGTNRGQVKLITTANGTIVGASVCGPGASEIIGVLSLAMDAGLPIQRLASLPSPHLSYLSNLIALGTNQTGSKTVSWSTVRLRSLRKYLPW